MGKLSTGARKVIHTRVVSLTKGLKGALFLSQNSCRGALFLSQNRAEVRCFSHKSSCKLLFLFKNQSRNRLTF